MADEMYFPKSWEEFEKKFKYTDKSEEAFIGEVEVIPCFRVRQWLDHIKSEHSSVADS